MILKNLESHANTLIRENEIDFHIINSHSDLPVAELVKSDAIIFRTDRVSHIKLEIDKIRKSDIPAIYLKPLFVTSQRAALKLKDDIDGVVESSDLNSIEEVTKEMIERIKKLDTQVLDPKLALSEKVMVKCLQYMFTRGRDLTPLRSRQAHMGYEYPFVRNILPNFELTMFLDKANNAKERNWIQRKLIDRVNLCRSCDGSYLHFTETCHKCSSIDIEGESLIHHFRCAYIGPESDFKQEDIFVCPKCDKVLRHIGVDYDKPSEVLNCNSCNHQSQQSAIVAKCVDCGKENVLDKLHSKEIFELVLTSEGEEIAKTPLKYILSKTEQTDKFQEYEIDSKVFDLLRKQEIKKTAKMKKKSYSVNIVFDRSVLDHLVPSEIEVFTIEFRTILLNYLDEVDLMTMRTSTEYDLMLTAKDKNYIEDMVATLQYNLNKIINDNFADPDHKLFVNATVLDEEFVL